MWAIKKRTTRGFTYLGILFAVVLMGIALSATGTLWSVASKREKERELLFVGSEFRKAIRQYYDNSPGAAKRYPSRLEDLLQDERQLAVVRHLRRIYRDPMTNKTQWGIVESPLGGIMGVHSLSTDEPLKKANFPQAYEAFENKKGYDEWKFVHDPLGLSGAAKARAAGSEPDSPQSSERAPATGSPPLQQSATGIEPKDRDPEPPANRPAR